MIRIVRKKRSFEQKQKRPNAHQVGKRLSIQKSTKQLATGFMKQEMLLATNKSYKKYDNQATLGAFLMMGPMFYFAFDVAHAVVVKVWKAKVLAMLIKRFITLSTIGLIRFPEQPVQPSFWYLLKMYFFFLSFDDYCGWFWFSNWICFDTSCKQKKTDY
ncbi:hypothetical protein RFF58_09620 [Streptococcus ruminantium]|nr:hypothetical protein [Streptococcus ruminantium]